MVSLEHLVGGEEGKEGGWEEGWNSPKGYKS